MLNTRVSVRTSWLRKKKLARWSRKSLDNKLKKKKLDSSSSFGQKQNGFFGKLQNYSSFCTRKITKFSQLKFSWSGMKCRGSKEATKK